MNKFIINFAMLAAGAAIGSLATYKILKTTYEQRIHEEIEELENYYSNKESGNTEETEGEGTPEEKPSSPDPVAALDSVLAKEGYINYSDIIKKKGGEAVKKPYIIPSKDFDTLDDYEAETLTYYSNGVLVDDTNKPIEDVKGMVGDEFQDHFGDNENDRDSVFVRNEERMTDYEILYDADEFEDDYSAYTVANE